MMFSSPLIILLVVSSISAEQHSYADSCRTSTGQQLKNFIDETDVWHFSGISASKVADSNIVWTTKDRRSENKAIKAYAFDLTPDMDDVQATIILTTEGIPGSDRSGGVNVRDIAITTNGTSYVHILDVGTQLGEDTSRSITRDTISVYKFPEPDISSANENGEIHVADTVWSEFKFDYPEVIDGTIDLQFETLLIDPIDNRGYLITRSAAGENAYVYSFSTMDGDSKTDLTCVGQITYSDIVGGDIDQSGERILLKTSKKTLLFFRTTGQPLLEALQGTNVCLMSEIAEVEADSGITFSKDESSFYVISASLESVMTDEPITTTATTPAEPGETLEILTEHDAEANDVDNSAYIIQFDFIPIITPSTDAGANLHAGMLTILLTLCLLILF